MSENYYQSPNLPEGGESIVKSNRAHPLPFWIRLFFRLDNFGCLLQGTFGLLLLANFQVNEGQIPPLQIIVVISVILSAICGVITNYSLYACRLHGIKFAYLYFVFIGINQIVYHFYYQYDLISSLLDKVGKQKNPSLITPTEIIYFLFLAIYLAAFFKARTIILHRENTIDSDSL